MTETAFAAAIGATIGGLAGSVAGLAVPGAVVGGLNGLVAGRRRIHDWRSPRSVCWFVLDSSWALPTTAAALVVHVMAAVRGRPGFVAALSERRDRHVYARGFQPRRGFAITVGNVVNGAGDADSPGRVRLVDDHEDVHVRQARILGPLFPLLYVLWMIVGALVGTIAWALWRRPAPLGKLVETYAYYLNPFEWWAYSRHGHWPPSGKLAGVGWRRPAVRSFAEARASVSPEVDGTRRAAPR